MFRESNMQENLLLINNSRVKTNDTIVLKNPYTLEVIAHVSRASIAEAAQAVEAAHAAFAVCRKQPAYQRVALLRKTAELITQHGDGLAETIALEAGKPIKAARVEVSRAAMVFQLAAEEALRIIGEVLPLDIAPDAGNRIGITRRFPLGPVLAITPFNFPLNLVAHKIAPAIAAGNTVVHKPSSAAPLTALRLGELLQEAGMPAGMVNVIPCTFDVAESLIADERIKMISFTGSPEVGWAIRAQAGKKKVALELGGNAGVIIEPDADLHTAVERCVFGGYVFAGQVCISVQRIYIHESIYKEFTREFVAGVKKLKTGDPLLPETDVGPLISPAEVTRVQEWIEEAQQLGGTVLTGGFYEGTIYQPTVLADVPKGARCVSSELFAPVTVLCSYKNFDEAIREVNDSIYGLQAGVFTKNIDKALTAFNRLDVGGVMINEVPTFRVDNFPYGGVKHSGLGREGVRYAIEEMTEIKIMVLHNSA
jgi:acyl-CoA reductase-like NAD-dependent aldehyde dehydrogenase